MASGPPPGVPVRVMPSREPVRAGGQPEVYNPMHVNESATAGHRALYGAGEGVAPRPAATFGAPVIRRPVEVELGTPVITRPTAAASRTSDMPEDQRERILGMAEQMRARPQEIHPADAIGISEVEARREVDERNYQRLLKSENERLLMEQRMAARSPHLPLEVQAAGFIGQSRMPNVKPMTERGRNVIKDRLDDFIINKVEGSDPFPTVEPIVVETKRPLGAPKRRKSINFKYDVKAND